MDADEQLSARRVLSKEELEKLPDDIRKKYADFFSQFLEMKALYETQKTNSGELNILLRRNSYFNTRI